MDENARVEDLPSCSFCDQPATSYVNDESDGMAACQQCYAAWQLDPGFTGESAKEADRGEG